MIKFLGSKRKLIPHILQATQARQRKSGTILDLFAGTTRVGQAFRQQGWRVISNDYSRFSTVFGECYIESAPDHQQVQDAVDYLNEIPGVSGWFTNTYCVNSRFFHPKNGERIDAIRDRIETDFSGSLKSVLLTSLIEAADRVDSTCGVQMAYLKKWAKRAENDMVLRVPEIPTGPAGLAIQFDAQEASRMCDADVVYLDPPYNQHSYRGNYHIWESLVLWDWPEVYGVAQKRVDCRTVKSDFNSKPGAITAMQGVVNNLRCSTIVTSFSNEGFLSKEQLLDMLSSRGHTEVMEIPYERYVGATIGVHSPSGEKVGTPTHTTNVEYIFVTKVKENV